MKPNEYIIIKQTHAGKSRKLFWFIASYTSEGNFLSSESQHRFVFRQEQPRKIYRRTSLVQANRVSCISLREFFTKAGSVTTSFASNLSFYTIIITRSRNEKLKNEPDDSNIIIYRNFKHSQRCHISSGNPIVPTGRGKKKIKHLRDYWYVTLFQAPDKNSAKSSYNHKPRLLPCQWFWKKSPLLVGPSSFRSARSLST